MEEVIYLQSPGKNHGQPPRRGYPDSRYLEIIAYLRGYNVKSEAGEAVWAL
jgi:hypothetical protein